MYSYYMIHPTQYFSTISDTWWKIPTHHKAWVKVGGKTDRCWISELQSPGLVSVYQYYQKVVFIIFDGLRFPPYKSERVYEYTQFITYISMYMYFLAYFI